MKQFCESFCISMLSILCVLPSFGVTNQQIARLMSEKRDKMAELEQCAKKVTGFKIAGISTLGLTAVGVGGNIALASKNKSLNKEISSTQEAIEKEEKKLASIEADIAKQQAANKNKSSNDAGEAGGQLPEIGTACSWEDQNDNWMLHGVYVRAGIQTETIGERWCNQNGVATPCVCSATKCLDGANEVDLSGIKVCQVDITSPVLSMRAIGNVCSQSDKNDKLMVKGFYKQVGGTTGMGGDMVCKNNDKPVVCTCSATQCADGTTEITLNGGVVACQTGGASKNTRILGQPCSVEDIAKTFSGSEVNFPEISVRADGVLKTKYSSEGEGYFKCFANSKSTKQQNCYCEIESCATGFAKFGGMCVADPKIEGRTIGAPCSRDDIFRTNSMLAAQWDADAEKTKSAKYTPTTNYGMVCSDGNGNAEYCMCGADSRASCTDGAQLLVTDDGLPICSFRGTPIRLAATPIKTLDTPSIPTNLPNIEKYQEVDVCEKVTEEGTCGLCGGSWIFDPLKKVGSCYGASGSYNTGKSNGLSLAPAKDTKTWRERQQERRQGRQDARAAKNAAEEQRRREEREKLDRELKEIEEALSGNNPEDKFL